MTEQRATPIALTAALSTLLVIACATGQRTLSGPSRDRELAAYFASLDRQCEARLFYFCQSGEPCPRDWQEACALAANNHAYGPPRLRDRARARTLYAQMCERTDGGMGCSELRSLDSEPRFPDAGIRHDGGLPLVEWDGGIVLPPRIPAPTDGGFARVYGSLDKEQIRAVIRWHEPEIDWCYESELRDRPRTKGRLSVKFVIDARGEVHNAQVARSTVSPELGQCVVEQVREWRFPRPKGGGVVLVTYPWDFPRPRK